MLQHAETIIIGGGPAGVSCAIWLKQLGISSQLLEASNQLGGLQARSPYENSWIPGVQGKTGQEIAENFNQHAHTIGVDVITSCPVQSIRIDRDDFELETSRGHKKAKYLVIATGTIPRSGGVTASANIAIGPGTPMEALDVKGKRIAIFGGGDNAFDQAKFVQNRGASKVVIFSRSHPRAQTLLQTEAKNIPVVIGKTKINQKKLTVNDEPFDAFGIMYGFEATIPPGLSLKRSGGYIKVNQRGQTSFLNVYACGEVTNYWHPCVSTACAHGIQVAKQIATLSVR